MTHDRLQSASPAGGIKGELPDKIDLRRPGDLNLAYRAVLNGWDVPGPMRRALVEQIPIALYAADEIADGGRRTRRVLKLARLALLMDTWNFIAEGCRPSRFPYLRRRFPERRRPRQRPSRTMLLLFHNIKGRVCRQ